VDKAEGGAKLVAEAGKTMDEIVTSVKRVTDIMSEIAAASVEQSSGIEQVNQAITQMDDVTQQNAALVEQAAASAESLEDQAGILSQAVARFRLSQSSAFQAQPRATSVAVHRPAPPARPGIKKPAGKRVEVRHPAKASAPNVAALKSEGGEDDWSEF
jgi:methyl-accepting chemotaxis protein